VINLFTLVPYLKSSSNFSNFAVQSGDVVNSPVTHKVVRVFDIDNENDGNMALYKVCSAARGAVFQTIDPSKYHDYKKFNSTAAKVIYAQYPSKVRKQFTLLSILNQAWRVATFTLYEIE